MVGGMKSFDQWAADLADRVARGRGPDCDTCNDLGAVWGTTPTPNGQPVPTAVPCPDCCRGARLPQWELDEILEENEAPAP